MQNQKTGIWIAAVMLLTGAVVLFCLALVVVVGGVGVLSRRLGPPFASGLSATPQVNLLETRTPTPTAGRSPTSTDDLDLRLETLSLTPTFLDDQDVDLENVATLTVGATVEMLSMADEPTASFAPALNSWCVPLNTVYQTAEVRWVIDGVTIEVSIQGEVHQVRYIGVDLLEELPDSLDWVRALDYNRNLVEGKMVLLARDQRQNDDLGRLLRYVIAEGVFVNRQMVEDGYAVAASLPPDVSCDLVFAEAEALAQVTGRGLWGSAPTATRTPFPPTPTVASSGDIQIAFLSYQGKGWQEADEFVEIRNAGAWPVQLRGWTISNSKGYTFTFTAFILRPGDYCRVYTNEYHPGTCGFSFNRPSPVWDNHGDCAFLRDASGALVDQYCYD
jgi:endonuclease YncB( thermonuclease family)